jgi:LCP family protein required for cell wall assembly
MGAFTGQLALQYAYADGQEKSCSLVIGQVADILKNEVPINGYVAMNLSCIGTVNDAVGGVTVEMDDDYTLYNAKFKKGATVHLQGEEAQEFVQGRDIMVSGSAYSRIGRQKRYLKAFISQAKKTLAQNPALAVNLMSQLSDYMLTDISTDEVLYLSTELSDCNFDEENMQILQGNIQMGEQYEEYYLDDEAVQQTIIDLFYEEQKK